MTGVKILVTLLVILDMVRTARLPDGVDLAGPDWRWRGGRKDPIRRLLYRDDGTLKPHARRRMCMMNLVGLAIIWCFF